MRTYKIHLDGYNFLPYLTGNAKEGPRKEIFYFSNTGDRTALRYNDWKAVFMEQKAEATLRAWIEPWTPLRVPLIFHLRRDPYERAYSTSKYLLRLANRPRVPASARSGLRGEIPANLKGIPAAAESSKPLDRQVMEKLMTPAGYQ